MVGAKRALLHQLAAEVPEPEERVEAQEEPMSPKFVDSGLARHTRCASWLAWAAFCVARPHGLRRCHGAQGMHTHTCHIHPQAHLHAHAHASMPPPCSIDEVQFPLRCGSWAAVACDLSDPAWSEALVGAGFDPRKPTVWVAEGERRRAPGCRPLPHLRSCAGACLPANHQPKVGNCAAARPQTGSRLQSSGQLVITRVLACACLSPPAAAQAC